MRSERFRCAINTLHMMLVHERWYEAKAIVFHEVWWSEDPPPSPDFDWQDVYLKLAAICRDRTGKYR